MCPLNYKFVSKICDWKASSGSQPTNAFDYLLKVTKNKSNVELTSHVCLTTQTMASPVQVNHESQIQSCAVFTLNVLAFRNSIAI